MLIALVKQASYRMRLSKAPPWTSLLFRPDVKRTCTCTSRTRNTVTKLNLARKGERRDVMACAWIRHVDVMLVSIALHRLGKVRDKGTAPAIESVHICITVECCDVGRIACVDVYVSPPLRYHQCDVDSSVVRARPAAVWYRYIHVVTLEARLARSSCITTALSHGTHKDKNWNRIRKTLPKDTTRVEFASCLYTYTCIRHYHHQSSPISYTVSSQCLPAP